MPSDDDDSPLAFLADREAFYQRFVLSLVIARPRSLQLGRSRAPERPRAASPQPPTSPRRAAPAPSSARRPK